MIRAREDRALEVWVGGGRQLAGWLTTHKNVPLSMHDVLVVRWVGDPDDEVEEARGFQLTTVREVLDEDAPVGLILTKTRLYAEPMKLPPGATPPRVQYTWKVLRLEQVDYDWLFDHPDFEPTDTGADRDYLATEDAWAEYMQECLEEELNDTLFPSAGTYSPFAYTGAITSNAASTGSAMTVKTLEKAMKQVHSAMGLPRSVLT